MKNYLKHNKRLKKGFTLVEVMVVAIVVAILAVGSIMMFGGQPETARTATRKMGATELNTALRYVEMHGYSVGNTVSDDIITSNVAGALADLNGFTITTAAGTTETINLSSTPNAADYTLTQTNGIWMFHDN